MTYIPLFIDVSGIGVTVFGGGQVGTRRALEFARAGARVRVVADRFTHELEVAAKGGQVELVNTSLRPGDQVEQYLRGSLIVVIATSDHELNKYIAARAREMGLLVNNATEASEGNVVYPFTAEPLEGLHVAVTSLGLSGIAARRARDKIVECLSGDRELASLLRVMSQFKRLLKSRVPEASVRVPLYFKVEADETFRRLIEGGDEEGALRRALEIAGIGRAPEGQGTSG